MAREIYERSGFKCRAARRAAGIQMMMMDGTPRRGCELHAGAFTCRFCVIIFFLPWVSSRRTGTAAIGGRRWSSEWWRNPDPPTGRRVSSTAAGCAHIPTTFCTKTATTRERNQCTVHAIYTRRSISNEEKKNQQAAAAIPHAQKKSPVRLPRKFGIFPQSCRPLSLARGL